MKCPGKHGMSRYLTQYLFTVICSVDYPYFYFFIFC